MPERDDHFYKNDYPRAVPPGINLTTLLARFPVAFTLVVLAIGFAIGWLSASVSTV